MVEIVFLTTNNTKVAHARYLCRNFNINIITHKKYHYGIGYEEPRILEREKLLEESVKDAIHRWKKNISQLENRLYFLEDTSVRIEALSNAEMDYPGVDIKFWMKDITFKELDNQLKSHGNNRSVIVKSHLVLVLTHDLQKFADPPAEYIIFHSETKGTIVNKELKFDTNKIYPWLDNKSFNKWFQPDNEQAPISMLPIEKADNYDFRKGAFEKMLIFLQNQGKIHSRYFSGVNYRLTLYPLFVITGATCAGKTTIGKYLLEYYNYFHIEASDFMHLEFYETHGNLSNIKIGDFAKEILKIRPFVVVDRVLKFLEKIENISSIVITGLRTIDEVNYFNEHSPLVDQIINIYIEANENIRYERWLNRNRKIENSNRNEFNSINKQQIEIGVENIKKGENLILISNESSLNEYFEEFSIQFLASCEKSKHELSIKSIVPKSLEEVIVLTLAERYRIGDYQYYTTTEISKIIHSTFPYIIKHKDNVSRYFNQGYHPYYECINFESKLKYRISGTGYSYSVLIERSLFTISSGRNSKIHK